MPAQFQYGENPEELHAHQCDSCGTVWQHKGWNRADLRAHTCPTCGNQQFRRIDEQVRNLNPYGLR